MRGKNHNVRAEADVAGELMLRACLVIVAATRFRDEVEHFTQAVNQA